MACTLERRAGVPADAGWRGATTRSTRACSKRNLVRTSRKMWSRGGRLRRPFGPDRLGHEQWELSDGGCGRGALGAERCSRR